MLSPADRTARNYNVLSVILFVASALLLAMLTIYPITDFAVLGLVASGIATNLNAMGRMMKLGQIQDTTERKAEARKTVRTFNLTSIALFAASAVFLAIGVYYFATDFLVLGLDSSGIATILWAIARKVQLDYLLKG